MFRHFYYTTALRFLTPTEEVVSRIAKEAKKLDRLTAHAEGALEEKAVILAKNAQQSRTALEIIRSAFDHLVAAVEAAFKRRERAVIADLDSLRAKIEKAAEVRSSVSNFLENL